MRFVFELFVLKPVGPTIYYEHVPYVIIIQPTFRCPASWVVSTITFLCIITWISSSIWDTFSIYEAFLSFFAIYGDKPRYNIAAISMI